MSEKWFNARNDCFKLEEKNKHPSWHRQGQPTQENPFLTRSGQHSHEEFFEILAM